jgi:hypothetical protein
VFSRQVRNRCQGLPGGTYPALYDCLGKDPETCLQDLDPVVGNGNQITDTLSISRQTVKNQLQKIFKKINVRGKVQAAVWAVKNLPS